jgi:hypothetical protein
LLGVRCAPETGNEKTCKDSQAERTKSHEGRPPWDGKRNKSIDQMGEEKKRQQEFLIS